MPAWAHHCPGWHARHGPGHNRHMSTMGLWPLAAQFPNHGRFYEDVVAAPHSAGGLTSPLPIPHCPCYVHAPFANWSRPSARPALHCSCTETKRHGPYRRTQSTDNNAVHAVLHRANAKSERRRADKWNIDKHKYGALLYLGLIPDR
jgi:hypothetical protein